MSCPARQKEFSQESPAAHGADVSIPRIRKVYEAKMDGIGNRAVLAVTPEPSLRTNVRARGQLWYSSPASWHCIRRFQRRWQDRCRRDQCRLLRVESIAWKR